MSGGYLAGGYLSGGICPRISFRTCNGDHVGLLIKVGSI